MVIFYVTMVIACSAALAFMTSYYRRASAFCRMDNISTISNIDILQQYYTRKVPISKIHYADRGGNKLGGGDFLIRICLIHVDIRVFDSTDHAL